MPKKKKVQDDAPTGGWMGPPPSYGVPAIARAVGTDRKGKWKFKRIKLSRKDLKKRKIWEDAVKKANKKGKWWFPNPFKKKGKKK